MLFPTFFVVVGFFRSNPWDSNKTPVPRSVPPEARSPCPSWCWTRSPRQEFVVPVVGLEGEEWWKTAITGREEFFNGEKMTAGFVKWPTQTMQKPIRTTINLHHVCSRGVPSILPVSSLWPPIYQLLLPPPRLLLSSSLLSSLRRLAFAGGVIDPFFGP